MKTLEQAYQTFNYEQLIQVQLFGNPQSINAYEECCGRYVGQNKVALIWEGKPSASTVLRTCSGGSLLSTVTLPAARSTETVALLSSD